MNSNMLHPAAYSEFRQWHYETLGRYPSALQLAWHWIKHVCGRLPIAPVSIDELRHPVYLRPWSSDLYVFEQIFIDREYDTPLTTPATIVDAGANIGLASVYFANRFPNARILALEPERQNFSMLQINTAPYSNIRCLRAGLWSHRTQLSLTNQAAKSWAFRFAEAGREDTAESVPALSLDDLMDQWQDGNAFDLVKIDIEGAEKNVFAAGGRWLSSATTIMVECHDRMVQRCEETVIQAVRPYAFTLRRSGEYLVFQRPAGGSVEHG